MLSFSNLGGDATLIVPCPYISSSLWGKSIGNPHTHTHEKETRDDYTIAIHEKNKRAIYRKISHLISSPDVIDINQEKTHLASFLRHNNMNIINEFWSTVGVTVLNQVNLLQLKQLAKGISPQRLFQQPERHNTLLRTATTTTEQQQEEEKNNNNNNSNNNNNNNKQQEEEKEEERFVSDERRWLSTSGLGVSWLHMRLDSTPKYYNWQPYK
jgi:hypothetical protein